MENTITGEQAYQLLKGLTESTFKFVVMGRMFGFDDPKVQEARTKVEAALRLVHPELDYDAAMLDIAANER